jgi:hypothetical protein
MIGTRQTSAKQNNFFGFIVESFRKGIYNYSIYNIIFGAKSQEKTDKK